MRQKENREDYEERDGSPKAAKIITSVALYGVALLLAYIAVATPETGTAMGSIRNVLTGLGGSLAIVIPVIIGWIATLTLFSARGKRVVWWRCAMNALLFICLFTAVQLFSAEKIVRERMTIPGFANFVDKSYGYGKGGGAIGALLAWPLYSNLGKFGGLIATILLAVLSLTATGKAGRFLRWSKNRAQDIQHDTDQRRKVREVERMFDYDDVPEPAAERPLRREPVRRERPQQPRPRRTSGAEPLGAPRPANRPRPSDGGARSAQEEKRPESGAQTVKKRRMYRETIEPEVPKAETMLDSAAEMDEGPTMAAFDGSNREVRRKAAAPDTSESVERMRSAKSASDAELKIAPDACTVISSADEPIVRAEPKKPLPKFKRTVPATEDDEHAYNYPPIDLLEVGAPVDENYRERDLEKAQKLEDTLKEFSIETKLTGIAHGPAVTRFELQPAPGVKVSRITSLADDIAMHLAAMSVRIEAPIPGKAAVGVEIPNEKVEMVRLRDVLESQEARKNPSKIAVGLGKDNSGRYIVADIAKMPHVLIAGQTGSGKSVCINSIISSILYRATPEEVRLILIDPKVVELSIYNGIPHLICPVVTDCKKAASALDWAVAEMSMRYKKFAERGVRDIKGYNKALQEGESIMPQMVIVIDELADLMMVAPGEVEDSICRLAQLARAAGMHLVIATQRPSVNVITGTIKANIPTRIAFSVASQIDSRTMIDHGGAEKLLGNGDMLFVPNGINKPMRVQGAWVSDEEVHAITTYIKERSETTYDPDMIEQMENSVRSDAEKEEVSSEYDERLPEAVEIVVEAGQASVSMLQRRMRVGYARAGRLIDEMEQRGIVSEADGAKPRTVLITREEYERMFEDEN